MKKLLMLGGAHAQVVAIQKARELGYMVIVCDSDVQNPGQQFAHAYYEISTVDRQAILQLAKRLQVDGVMCYGADSGAATVAYVANTLGLPANPLAAIDILTNKEKLRIFQKKAGLHVPKACGYASLEEVLADIEQFTLPVMVKPVDAAGSKGVSKIEHLSQLASQVSEALRYSKSRRFIVEEYIDSPYPHIGGEGFSVDGQLVFHSLSNEYFSTTCSNPFISILATWPSVLPARLQHKVYKEIQRHITLLHMKTSAYNFDIRIDADENVYIIELAPRNGGCWNPETVQHATGVDLIAYSIRAALGEDCQQLTMTNPVGYFASYFLHSKKDGRFMGLDIDEAFERNHLVAYECTVKQGQYVYALSEPQHKLGTMIFSFSSMEEMMTKLDQLDNWIQLKIDQQSFHYKRRATFGGIN